MATSTTSNNEERAIDLLGKGIPPHSVALTLGVDPSRVSQWLADDKFANSVIEKKFVSLSKQIDRDSSIDSLEDKILDQLKFSLPMMTRPMEILKAFSVINSAKRRGIAAEVAPTQAQTIVNLNIPQVLVQHFTKNTNNQVIQVGEQSLLTIQSGTLLKKVEAENDAEQQRVRTIEDSRNKSISSGSLQILARENAVAEQRTSTSNAAVSAA